MPNSLQSETDSRIELLSAKKRELLALLMEENRSSSANPGARIQKAEGVEAGAPLSFAQERMWFLDQMDPGNTAYNICKAIRVQGLLRMDILERTFSEIIRRHSVLRTTYREVGGEPLQFVSPPTHFCIPVADLSSLPCPDQEIELRRCTNENVTLPFDLENGFALRLSAIRLAPDDHVILFAVHHIAFDGWSMNLLFGELRTLYSLFLDEAPALPRLPEIQYTDYSVWQQRWITESSAEAQLRYWSKQLEGMPDTFHLSQFGADSLSSEAVGGSETLTIESSLAARIQQFARKHNLTTYMVYLAALEVLLHRYTGETDIAIGTPVANRTRTETHDVIGMFVNTLVLRGDLTHDLEVRELVEQVRRTTLDAIANQEYPFERLVKALRPERTAGRHPFFEIMLVLQNGMSNELELPGCDVSFIDTEPHAPLFDITLTLSESGEETRGWIEFDRRRFDQGFVRRFAGHFRHLLAQFVRDPSLRITQLEILTEAEQLNRAAWNRTEYPHEETGIVGAIDNQASRTPDAIAAMTEDQSVTYRDLVNRANQIARYLHRFGVHNGARVGISAERSVEMLTALLGILKAGAAYVPLDPTYPHQRLSSMVEDADICTLILTREGLAQSFPGYSGAVVALDRDLEDISHESVEWEGGFPGPLDPMYVIYTSGSTGRPKGVINTYRGVENRLRWMHRAYPEMSTGRILQKTSIGFDVSVWELFLPLMYGGTEILARPGAQADPDYIADLIESLKVETIHFVPSMLRTFLEVDDLERRCSTLRRIICSGEELPYDLVERAVKRLRAEVHNLYGPTEAAIDVTSWWCVPDWPHSRVPIGKPIDNIQIHILDSRGSPVPVGVQGEIFIGGIGVASGYLNRPELTDQRFLPDRFSEQAAAHLYRTGDLGSYLEDGNILFFGRSDDQVKIRGNRVELGEIESVLQSFPWVRGARAVVFETVARDPRIVAYVLSDAQSFEEQPLRIALKASLPSFMLPAAIVRIDEIPLTQNQKLDRSRLPRPEHGRSTTGREANDAESAIESELRGMWQTVLNVDSISPDDNFFDLGGHSLLLIQLRRMIADRMHTNLPMVEFFSYPTLRSLASRITSAAPSSAS